MYRTAELRRYQYYVNSKWLGVLWPYPLFLWLIDHIPVGGVYASPSLSGSRYSVLTNK